MRKAQKLRGLAFFAAFIITALAIGAVMVNLLFESPLLEKISLYLFLAAGMLFLLIVVQFLLAHRIYRGVRYFWYHWTIKNCLEKQMLDAGFGLQRSWYTEVPKVKLSFSSDLSTGTLTVKNSIHCDQKLDKKALSSALTRFVVECHYLTDDGNHYVYELLDGSVSFKLNFNSFNSFLSYSTKVEPYKLFLDGRSAVKLQHCLLVGLTGSGKTYLLYSFILQLLNKPISYQLYFADPKGSSLAVMGNVIAPNRTAVDMPDIISMLEKFVGLMRERKAELQEHLKSKLDADYSTFGLEPHVFICDEYASVSAVLASSDKKTRDHVKALLYEVVLQGRQLGFFLCIAMQKSDATLIDTALRDNLPLKVVLGNSEQQTYVTAFGTGVDIPSRHFAVGEGVFTEPQLAPQPKLLQAPFLGFDILEACKQSPRGVTTRAPQKQFP